MGGGRDRFTQPFPAGHPGAGSTTLAQARAAEYAYASDRAGLLAAPDGTKFLGLFDPGALEAEWTGPAAAPYPGPGPVSCTESNPAFGAQPHLLEMTRKAIDLLDEGKRGKGFFLQVEGPSIDKQDHAADPCAQIGETSSSTGRSRWPGTGPRRTRTP